MPAYDRPIQYNLPPAAPKKDSIAAVLVFDCSVDEMQRVQAFIDSLKARGIVRAANVAAYDSKVTSAELYFP